MMKDGSGEVDSSPSCGDVKKDPKNCGRCGYVCESYQQCLEGTCSPRYESSQVTPSNPGTIWGVVTAPDAVFVVGVFKGTADFDPGVEEKRVSAMGTNGDIYVSRYDSQGAYSWTRTLPSAAGVNVVHATSAPDGSVLVYGYYQGTMDFLSAYGGFRQTARTMNADEGFVLKIRSDGSVGFLRTLPANAGFSSVFRAKALADGSVVLVGPMLGPIDFGSGPQFNGVRGAFLAKLSSAGMPVWARSFPQATIEVVTGSSSGSLLAAGSVEGTVDLDPGPGVVQVTSTGGKGVFVLRLDADGAYAASGSVQVGAQEVVPLEITGDSESIYVAGRMSGGSLPTGTEADPRPKAAAGAHDAFIIKFSAGGSRQWGRLFGGPAYDYAQRVTLVPGGVMVMGAFASPSVDFGPDGSPDVRSLSMGSLFVTRLGGDGSYRGTFGLAATPTLLETREGRLLIGGSCSGRTDLNPRTDEKMEGCSLGGVFVSSFSF